jgi:hypothetical protein
MLKKAVQQGRRRVETGGGTDRTSWGRSPVQWILANGKTPPALPPFEKLYRHVEDIDEPRTQPGKRRVSARRGWAGEKGGFFSTLLSPAHREHHSKPRLTAHHAIVGGSGLFKRICLDHWANAGQRTVVECVF